MMTREKRQLEVSDLERMCVPKRYWMSRFDLLSNQNGNESIKSFVGNYISNIEEMKKRGVGFILYGKNGVGKSCASVVVAKEYRSRGYTVLFLEAANLKSYIFNKVMFDDTELFFERAKSVDVLIVDDFGKGIQDSTGFGAASFDELVRTRSANLKVTIITSNIPPNTWEQELELKYSSISSIRECMVPVHVEGAVLRESAMKKVADIFSHGNQ